MTYNCSFNGTFDDEGALSFTAQPSDNIPEELCEMASALFEELVTTFTRAMKRRGIVPFEVGIFWKPEGSPKEAMRKLKSVTRLRAVIETEH